MTTTHQPIEPGTKLDNGATVIQTAHDSRGNLFALCHWGTEYATWQIFPGNRAEFGHYFPYFHDARRQSSMLADAAADLRKRSAE